MRIVSEKNKQLIETEVLLLTGGHLYSLTNSLALSSITGAATQKEPVTDSEKLN